MKFFRPFSNFVPLLRRKKTRETETSPHFVDHRVVKVKAGNGGDGCISFARIFGNEFAGPDGGDGGSGGHVVFKATPSKTSLSHLPPHIQAPHGARGRNDNCTGANGSHLLVPVPLGTMIKNEERVLAELSEADEIYIAAKGGGGGRGNKYFASPQNQTPQLAEFGGQGEEFKLLVEMGIIADFGLVGFPNAGKSTLLRAISRARPKVAGYAFTTVRPHVGVCFYDDYEKVTVMDTPGLLPNSTHNHYLGAAFLRHITRCTFLIYVLDFTTNPLTQLSALKSELHNYNPTLPTKKSIVVANKMDMEISKENYKIYSKEISNLIPLSGKCGMNLKQFLITLRSNKF